MGALLVLGLIIQVTILAYCLTAQAMFMVVQWRLQELPPTILDYRSETQYFIGQNQVQIGLENQNHHWALLWYMNQ